MLDDQKVGDGTGTEEGMQEPQEGQEGFAGYTNEQLAAMTDAELDAVVGHQLTDEERQMLRESVAPPEGGMSQEMGDELWRKIEGGLGQGGGR